MTNTAAVQPPSDYPNAPADYSTLNAALDALDDLLIDAQQAARKGAPSDDILDRLSALRAGVDAALTHACEL